MAQSYARAIAAITRRNPASRIKARSDGEEGRIVLRTSAQRRRLEGASRGTRLSGAGAACGQSAHKWRIQHWCVILYLVPHVSDCGSSSRKPAHDEAAQRLRDVREDLPEAFISDVIRALDETCRCAARLESSKSCEACADATTSSRDIACAAPQALWLQRAAVSPGDRGATSARWTFGTNARRNDSARGATGSSSGFRQPYWEQRINGVLQSAANAS